MDNGLRLLIQREVVKWLDVIYDIQLNDVDWQRYVKYGYDVSSQFGGDPAGDFIKWRSAQSLDSLLDRREYDSDKVAQWLDELT